MEAFACLSKPINSCLGWLNECESEEHLNVWTCVKKCLCMADERLQRFGQKITQFMAQTEFANVNFYEYLYEINWNELMWCEHEEKLFILQTKLIAQNIERKVK